MIARLSAEIRFGASLMAASCSSSDGAVGFVPGVGPLVFGIVSIWMLVAMVIAVRQSLDYTSTVPAVGVSLVGWVVSGVISFLFFGLVVS